MTPPLEPPKVISQSALLEELTTAKCFIICWVDAEDMLTVRTRGVNTAMLPQALRDFAMHVEMEKTSAH